jgi:uncharacterized protein (DUF58 family)
MNMEQRIRDYLCMGRQAGGRYALRARKTGRGLTGTQLGIDAGRSLEFVDHREYQPGDDLRTVDWSVYARSERLTVKLYQDEVRPAVDIILDGSASMDLADSEKLRAALGLAGMISESARNSDYFFRVWQTGRGTRRVENGSETADRWEGLDFSSEESPEESFRRELPALKPKGIRIFISDLFWVGDPMHVLLPLAHQASVVVVVMVLAGADVNPAERGHLRLVDSETGITREIMVDESAVKCYCEKLEQHQQNWNRACRQVGAVMTRIVAEEFTQTWQLDDLVSQGLLDII